MNLDNLPKWAQRHILELELAKESLRTDLAQYQGEEDSPISIQEIGARTPVKNGVVRFQLAPHKWVDVRLDLKTQTLLIFGSTGVYIRPQASNHFLIGIPERE